MLTNRQKQLLEKRIYNLIKESIFENGFDENYFMERGEGRREKHDTGVKSSEKGEKNNLSGKEELVYKWLDSAQEIHSVLAYELYPDLTKDGARSQFSKKYRGEDDNGKQYKFDELEINKLFNMRDDFINKAEFDKA